ncbi:hypothetical protein [Rhodopirellula bahusiensis]|uniref:hypothetical protein n=1 Tax=Rhodopirellula bahusiensis TaxID=2014065 RepID=UPI0032678FD2
MSNEKRTAILELIDPEAFIDSIVNQVVDKLRPLIATPATTPFLIGTREETRKILRWSMSKLDAETKAKTIPSIMRGGRRLYVIADVLDSLRAGTEAAEIEAAARQAAKQAKRKAAMGDRS